MNAFVRKLARIAACLLAAVGLTAWSANCGWHFESSGIMEITTVATPIISTRLAPPTVGSTTISLCRPGFHVHHRQCFLEQLHVRFKYCRWGRWEIRSGVSAGFGGNL